MKQLNLIDSNILGKLSVFEGIGDFGNQQLIFTHITEDGAKRVYEHHSCKFKPLSFNKDDMLKVAMDNSNKFSYEV